MRALALAVCALAALQEPRTELESEVRSLLAPLYPPAEPGAVVLVARGGEVLVHTAFGSVDIERDVPMRFDAIFELASVTKALTATAVLALADEGVLARDAAVSQLHDGLPEAWAAITVEQLLAHTAGFPDCLDRADLASWMRQRLSLDELVASFADRPPAFPPGTDSAYSNSNYALLALFAERVTEPISSSRATRCAGGFAPRVRYTVNQRPRG